MGPIPIQAFRVRKARLMSTDVEKRITDAVREACGKRTPHSHCVFNADADGAKLTCDCPIAIGARAAASVVAPGISF